LTIHANYDFEENKLIPKSDLSHQMKKLTTSMFAFSETDWEPRAKVYLASISKLKEADWKNIIDAAAEYSNVMKARSFSKEQSKKQQTEEEQELEWDSDSD
jgi:hypothetical protein